MKSYRSLLFILILTVACNKEQVQKQQPATANDVENATEAATKTQILTARPWRYQKLQVNYNPQTKTGKVVYKRGATNNLWNLDNVVATYKKLGAYDELDSVGVHHPGTWKFKGTAANPTGTDSVVITYTGNPSPLTYSVKTLTASNYNVVYRFGNTLRAAAFIRVN